MNELHRDIIDNMIQQMEWSAKSRTVWTPDFIEPEVVVSLKALRQSEIDLRARVAELEDIVAGKSPLIDGGDA